MCPSFFQTCARPPTRERGGLRYPARLTARQAQFLRLLNLEKDAPASHRKMKRVAAAMCGRNVTDAINTKCSAAFQAFQGIRNPHHVTSTFRCAWKRIPDSSRYMYKSGKMWKRFFKSASITPVTAAIRVCKPRGPARYRLRTSKRN